VRLPIAAKPQSVRTEQIILFRVSGQLLAVSSASVQEVRSVDTLAGAAREISSAGIRKVRHIVQRGEHTLYVVNGAMHFGLPASHAALVFILRRTRTALLIDGIEKMTTMTRLQALPSAFCHEERDWYRGLTALDQTVVPVVKPEGFLTPDELFLLDSTLNPPATAANSAGAPPSVFEGGGLESTLATKSPGVTPVGFKGLDQPNTAESTSLPQ
jgi:chemotaxis signal transduction protein